ncbi:hypothetical protein [Campylobacter concisus]|nr:hypothetical protein [Campylobacter concisus]
MKVVNVSSINSKTIKIIAPAFSPKFDELIKQSEMLVGGICYMKFKAR